MHFLFPLQNRNVSPLEIFHLKKKKKIWNLKQIHALGKGGKENRNATNSAGLTA